MVLDVIKAIFSTPFKRALGLFFASFFLTVGIAACTGGEGGSIKSQAKISPEDIARIVPAGQTLERIKEQGQVNIAVPADFPPFGSVGVDMQPQGYDIDVAKQIAEGLGVKAKLIPVVGNYRIPFLQTDRVDLIISSLGKNKERAAIIDFSAPYAPFFSGVYGKKDIKVSSIEDLNGQSIGVAQGSLEDLEISKLPPDKVNIKRYAGNSLTASALVSGQVDLIATGNVVAAKLIKDNPDLNIENKFIMKDSPCYIGMRKGDTDLLQAVNQILGEMKTSGKLNELSLKWFGEPLPADLQPVATR